VIRTLSRADAQGLNAPDYEPERLEERAGALLHIGGAAEELALFDLAMTITLMRYLSDLHAGRVEPQRAGFALDITAKPLDLPVAVRDIATAAAPVQRIAAFEPSFPMYARLTDALTRYRTLAAAPGLEPLPPVTLREPGTSYAAVPALRHHLTILGDLPGESRVVPAHSHVYDDELVHAVERFQRRHGLAVDGIVGPNTRATLQVPMDRRVVQIQLALERLRWLPDRIETRAVLVNIPEFRLRGLIRGRAEAAVEMNVIVGSASRRHYTPILHADMRHVVFRPYWNVPFSITRKEILPRLAHDRDYLRREHLEIISRSDRGTVVHPPTAGNIARLASGTFRLRQTPGPHNSLGLVKLVFPNPADVCLHGTPFVQLFQQSRRDFSHGCIRVADPAALAAFALWEYPEWTPERIEQAMYGARTLRVDLPSPIPVYLFYSTAVADADSDVFFFEDIYGYDEPLEGLLTRTTCARAPGTTCDAGRSATTHPTTRPE
jgi:murein L,D-transpeptidase YcbB/YkuD